MAMPKPKLPQRYGALTINPPAPGPIPNLVWRAVAGRGPSPAVAVPTPPPAAASAPGKSQPTPSPGYRFALGGPVRPGSAPSVFPLTIQGNRDWLQNWYQKRTVAQPVVQAALDADRPGLTRPYPAISLWDKPLVEQSGPLSFVTFGKTVTNRNNPDATTIGVAKQTLSPSSSGFLTDLHEGNHAVTGNAQNYQTEGVNAQVVKQLIVPKDTYKQFLGVTAGDPADVHQMHDNQYDYLANPHEIHSRVMVLRRLGNVQPGEVVTPQRLNQIMLRLSKNPAPGRSIQNTNVQDLLNMTGGDGERIRQLMNLLTSNAGGNVPASTTVLPLPQRAPVNRWTNPLNPVQSLLGRA